MISRFLVRPLAGAGIEIQMYCSIRDDGTFAPSRGRELKYNPGHLEIGGNTVRPLAGAGIEIQYPNTVHAGFTSSPPRGGGN